MAENVSFLFMMVIFVFLILFIILKPKKFEFTKQIIITSIILIIGLGLIVYFTS
ncbi:hypothetical protein [Psychrobacillus vulpis]|uniref:hypothetical protein n=1 Tax=Psychrobacillus vulpis TaxID=2325572 RepID=UPI00140B9B98|nr:hypothetical protein [Psychrobacillus vulpis]